MNFVDRYIKLFSMENMNDVMADTQELMKETATIDDLGDVSDKRLKKFEAKKFRKFNKYLKDRHFLDALFASEAPHSVESKAGSIIVFKSGIGSKKLVFHAEGGKYIDCASKIVLDRSTSNNLDYVFVCRIESERV